MLVTCFRTVLGTAGQISCACVLFGSNLLIGVIDATARSIVEEISAITLARIEQNSRTPHSERVRTFQKNRNDPIVCRPGTGNREGGNEGPSQVMDEAETLKKTVSYAKKEYPEATAATAPTWETKQNRRDWQSISFATIWEVTIHLFCPTISSLFFLWSVR